MKKPIESGLTPSIILAFVMCLAGCARPAPQIQPLTNRSALNAVVWASQRTGTYYCRDSFMYGKADGAYMKQAIALGSGYQPEFGAYCSSSESLTSTQRSSTE